jgi:hypothetical protein
VFVAEFFLNTFAHVPLVGFAETPPIGLSSRVFIYFVQKGSDASRCLMRLLASVGHIGSLLEGDGKRGFSGLERPAGGSSNRRSLRMVLRPGGFLEFHLVSFSGCGPGFPGERSFVLKLGHNVRLVG